jgi:hypothetical protein
LFFLYATKREDYLTTTVICTNVANNRDSCYDLAAAAFEALLDLMIFNADQLILFIRHPGRFFLYHQKLCFTHIHLARSKNNMVGPAKYMAAPTAISDAASLRAGGSGFHL